MSNKAHTAVVNRIVTRYQGTALNGGLFDVSAGEWLIAVETTATLATTFARIQALTGTHYIAVTNQESLDEALRLTDGTSVGVMNSQGDIVKTAE
ncbi:hypothetical protein [Anatilimnocola floriformis]|uniref:hypothetical protein n=1 Tax=Anatilimnocola floriformis TaxID=2948575 RepID=UPI0020C48BA1|nr:hypothetical protein [Anatilimnocola floriformis]